MNSNIEIDKETFLKIVKATKERTDLENLKFDLESIHDFRIVGGEDKFFIFVFDLNGKKCLGGGFDLDTQAIAENLVYYDSSNPLNLRTLSILPSTNNNLKVDNDRQNFDQGSNKPIESDSEQVQQSLRFISCRFKLFFFHPKWGINFSAYLFSKREGKSNR